MDRIGRYKIVRELGRGAMGVVYHAIDPNIGRPVAIKTIQFGDNRKPGELDRMRERLFREARSAGMLSHPGIVTIYDVEQQGDLAYIAMEYVDGPTLDQVLGEPDPLDAERMFSILAQTSVALDYAHSKGIVHRDIKPANIMLSQDGTAKITDFGIAKITAAENLTMTGSIVGTPHYMSPEQVQGQPVDGRSDQFSLAVIGYEMLTGEKPYTGEHLTTVVYKIVAEEPVPPRRLNPSLSNGIENVLRKALAKKPDARYRNCQDFVESLEKACSASKGWTPMPRGGLLNAPTMADMKAPPVVAPAPAPAALPPPRRKGRPEPAATATTETKRKSGFPAFLLAVLVAAGLLALIGWQAAPWLMPGRSQPSGSGARRAAASKEDAPVPAAPPVTTPLAIPGDAAGDAKPSPVGPAVADAEVGQADPGAAPPAKKEPEAVKPPAAEPSTPAPKTERRPPPVRAGPPQEVSFLSSPGGATATLDGNPSTACSTPCALRAAPGLHTVALTLPGHHIERREFTVGASPLELTPVELKPAGGTLMLTSVPAGAAISVNGKRIDQVTPAQIPLGLGVYSIMIEKGGQQATEKVEVKNGITTRKIILGQ
ncbi:MAG: protein kinase [Candidatus Solibacter sp.]|nr:protein kinase [Candidatus Solibacter sp.]